MALHHSPSIVTNGLVLCLDAANVKSYPGTGSTWYDLSGNGNNGTLVNGSTYSNGTIVFDGVNDGVSLPKITPTTEATFNSWININGANSNYGAIFANWSDSGGGQAYWIGTNANQSTTIQVYFNGALINSISSRPLNTWMLLTITHSGSLCKGYINGVELFSTASTLITSNNNTSIGYDVTRSNYPFKGSISNACIYNRALGAVEVKQNFNALKGRYGL